MNNSVMRKEMIEAINSGEQALNKLKEAQTRLNSASNWGILSSMWYCLMKAKACTLKAMTLKNRDIRHSISALLPTGWYILIWISEEHPIT